MHRYQHRIVNICAYIEVDALKRLAHERIVQNQEQRSTLPKISENDVTFNEDRPNKNWVNSTSSSTCVLLRNGPWPRHLVERFESTSDTAIIHLYFFPTYKI